jgi:coproporphyrinogen III oxidase-like Fe-S oxidoreductase
MSGATMTTAIFRRAARLSAIDRSAASKAGNGRFEVNYWSSKTTWTLGSGAVSMTGALTAVDM